MERNKCENYLRDILNEKDIYQKDLAKGTGISLKSINRYTNSQREPRISDAIIIADYLNVEVSDIWPRKIGRRS